MSANRWSSCPKCYANAVKEAERRARVAAESYGKVSPEEYLELRGAAENPPDVEPTMREDWDLGVEPDGTFSIDYRASCNICGFRFRFKQEAAVLAAAENHKP
jgi:hypothetical protein